jgi:hypothetical protein
MNIGDRVKIERDETHYPSKGTWVQFRGKTGTVVEVNLGEYGVCFGKVTPRKSRPGSSDWDSADVAWFQPYELKVLARGLQRGSAAATTVSGVAVREKALAHKGKHDATHA